MADTEETLNELTNGGQPPSDSSSDSDSEEPSDIEIAALETMLIQNPYLYDTHLEYIKGLRKLGEIEKLRVARESMSRIYPLSPAMWQEWIRDETSLSSGEESFDVISDLYERGVRDYLSVSLWGDYINFVQERDPVARDGSPVGISKIRDLFERAIPAAGLHVTEGARIWEAYIKFEQNFLQNIDDKHTEQKEKQLLRIRSIFQRYLSIPLQDLSSSLLAYKCWESEQGGLPKSCSNDFNGIPSHISSAYEKAMEMFKERATYEEQISRQDAPTEKLQSFMSYLTFEKSSGDPARAQILYERAVTEFPVTVELWLDYTHYMDETLKVGRSVLDIHSRATRNCIWVGELWVRYLLSLERSRASEEDLSNVFEKSLLSQCISSFEEYLDLFLTRIDGLRRRLSSAGSSDVSVDYSLVRDTFQRATDFLSPQLKNTDGLLRLHAYWARMELNHGKDLVVARGVWESLLKTSGSMLEAWKEYIAMEIETGHIDEARRIYKRCYSKRFPGTGSEEICYSWIRFEREFGAIEDYDHALRKVTPRLQELQLFRLQQDAASGEVAKKEEPKKAPQQKRKMDPKSSESQPTPPKKPKGAATHQTTRFAKEAAATQQKQPIEEKEVKQTEQSSAAPKKEVVYNDQCTAFLSNISLQASDKDLRELFGDIGGVTGVRVLKDKFTGKSRGLAYVDFSDDAHLTAALEKNRVVHMNRTISVKKSDPNQKRGGGKKGDHGKGYSESRGSSGGNSSFELKGKNTFAVPRNVARPLGVKANKDVVEENLSSNDEFRKLLLKK
ncbi:hypothetical protein ACHQM5_023173 [Ranunculus cassubicifolius]